MPPADEVEAEEVPVAVGVLPVVQDDSGVGLVGEEPDGECSTVPSWISMCVPAL